ncbi:MAG: hypothetical protein ABJA80_12085 [bacterium]
MSERNAAGQPIALALGWVIVLIPTAWGVWQTIVKSLALFR